MCFGIAGGALEKRVVAIFAAHGPNFGSVGSTPGIAGIAASGLRSSAHSFAMSGQIA